MSANPGGWLKEAAEGIVLRLDGDAVRIDGEQWLTDAEDADGDRLTVPGQIYLTSDDGRTLLVRIDVTVVEGTPT